MLIPVGASALDIEAAEPAIEVCNEALDLDSSKTFLIIPSKIRTTTAAGKELRMVLKQLGPVSKADIGLRQAFADASTTGEGIDTFSPKSKAHKEIQTLTTEVIDLLRSIENGKKTCLAS
jgi:cellulose biosynthesis protein BcsQ